MSNSKRIQQQHNDESTAIGTQTSANGTNAAVVATARTTTTTSSGSYRDASVLTSKQNANVTGMVGTGTCVYEESESATTLKTVLMVEWEKITRTVGIHIKWVTTVRPWHRNQPRFVKPPSYLTD
jgi:hypothetical protein